MPGRDVPWLGDRRRSKPRNHTLSTDYESASYNDWKSKALDGHLDVCVDSIIGWRYFEDAVADPRAQVYGARSRDDDCGRIVPVAIVWRRGNDWASLYEGKRWDEDVSEEAVAAEQACCDLLGVGTHPSPGALGAETMLHFLPKNHPAPAANVAKLLRDHLVGGRAELCRPVVRDECYEIDRSMAYCAEAAKGLPVGRAVMLPEGTPAEVIESYATWFCACTVIVRRPLKLGPFPIRDAYGNISFPTKPGTYITWLWKEEAANCRAAGCVVDVGGGIGYRELAPVLAEWARFMFQKRGEAATKRIADKVKQVTVAAIGRMAMGTTKWVIVQSYKRDDDGNTPDDRGLGEGRASSGGALALGESRHGHRSIRGLGGNRHGNPPCSETGIPDAGCSDRIEPLVDDNGSPLGCYAVATEDHTQARLIQWASYIWMQARRTLYARQLDEVARRNKVLWSNFDSLGLAHPSKLPVTTGELGAWREALLTNVVVTVARGLVCDQRVTLPGCHGEARERAIAYAVAIRQAHEREREERPRRSGLNGFEEGWEEMQGKGGRRRLGGPRRRPRD